MDGLARLARSLTFRLALFYLLLFVLSVGLLLGGAFWVGVAQPLRAVQAAVEREATVLEAAYESEQRAAFIARLEAREVAPHKRAAYHALIAPDGAVLAANILTWPAPKSQRDWLRFEFESYDGGDEVEHEATARDITFADGVRLIVGRDTEDIDEREDFLSETLLWGAILTLAIGLAGGLMMSLTVGRRLEAVANTARSVIAGDLSGRVDVRGSGDDFDNLAETLNEMLARIEHLFQSVSRVSDSIAHELRTPLTRLQADLEELEAAQSVPERERLVRQARAEAQRLQGIFDALLRIARIEAGRHRASHREIDLTTLLADAVDFHRPEAEGKQQQLEEAAEAGLTIHGDPDLIFQAVSNLLDNAIKYCPSSGRVVLRASRAGDAVTVSVSDNGPGVQAEHRPHLTERFFRAPELSGAQGAGLGLALVAAVAQLHHADLSFDDMEPGLRVSLRFPA